MRVLYISKALVVAAHRDKLRALRRAVEVEAIIPETWGDDEVEPGPADIPVTRRRVRWSGRDNLHYYPGLGQAVRDARPDLVHIDEEPYRRVTAQAARICQGRGIPSLFFAGQNLSKRLPPPFGLLRRRVYRRVSAGIAGTEAAAAMLRETGFDKSLAVIPQFGVDPERFRPDVELRAAMREKVAVEPSQFVVVYAGHLEERKGVFVLLDAVAGLSDVRLLLVGAGSARDRILQRAAALGFTGRLRIVGWVPSEEMPRWFNLADVTVLPSLSTPSWVAQSGRVLIESMACGVPVIGSTSGEIPRVVGDAGVVVPEGDARALASAIEHLHHTPTQRAALGQRGRRRATTRFTHAVIADQTVDFYRRIIAETV